MTCHTAGFARPPKRCSRIEARLPGWLRTLETWRQKLRSPSTESWGSSILVQARAVHLRSSRCVELGALDLSKEMLGLYCRVGKVQASGTWKRALGDWVRTMERIPEAVRVGNQCKTARRPGFVGPPALTSPNLAMSTALWLRDQRRQSSASFHQRFMIS